MNPPTPTPQVTVADYQQYQQQVPATYYLNHSGTWRMIAAGGWGLVGGLVLAWFTAFRERGVTQQDMQQYVKEYSPYSFDKQTIIDRNSAQDQQIGILLGYREKTNDRLNSIESNVKDLERQAGDQSLKLKQVADLLEAEQKLKR